MSDLIIRNMSAESRKKAEAFAKSKGLTLEEAVAEQLKNELTERDLDGVTGGGFAPVHEVNIEHADGREENVEYA